MKKILLLPVLLLCILGAQAQPSIASLNAQLCEMGNQDQQARLTLNDAVRNSNIDQIQPLAEILNKTDRNNQQALTSIIREWGGIPGGLSEEAYNAIFLIIDHADLKYQKQNIRHLKKAQEQGFIQSGQIAVLRDRMLMTEGKRQIYGTQTKAKPIVITSADATYEMVTYVWATRHHKSLDKRRAEAGLGTMQSQIAGHEKYGYTAIFDPSLSKREINRLTNSGKTTKKHK